MVGVSESEALSKSIANLHQDYDIVLIDGTPNLSKMTTRIILASDILLIPTRPSAQDFRTLEKFQERYEEAKAFKENIPAYFILNEYSDQKKVHEGINQMMNNSFDIPIFETTINSRVAYSEVSVIGKGVYEYTDMKAKIEMVKLTKEVVEKAKEHGLIG